MHTSTSQNNPVRFVDASARSGRRPLRLSFLLRAFSCLTLLAAAGGCASDPGPVAAQPPPAQADAIIAGDVLKINFVGAQNMDTQQEVRRDGRITLPIAGDVVAAGKTPTELADDLSKRFSADLLSSQVLVTVVSSAFSVHVSGAVLRPGKYSSKGPMTALEAVMEAGGFDGAKANMRRVVVVRHENGAVRDFVLDLSKPLSGEASQPFYLKPADIVYVPTRFVWF